VNSDSIERLQRAILRIHGCAAQHVESITVTRDSRIAWDGIVEVFDLAGHPKAKRCYSWETQDGEAVVVLKLPPLDSARRAVQSTIPTASGWPEAQEGLEKCWQCGAPAAMKYGRFGRFLGCTRYPDCQWEERLPPERDAPPK